jgi:AcrR family transcriptional regulator
MRLSKARKACVTTMMKDTIFEAASSLLEQQGSDALTMNQVATKVGFATASLYNYFQDKDDLLHFCYSRLVEPCLQAIEEAAGADLPATQKLERILRAALEHAARHQGLLKLMAGMDYDSKIRRDTRPRLLQILTSIFQRGITEGTFRPHDPTHTGRMFLGCLLEVFDLQASGASNQDVNRFAETLIDATLNGFSICADMNPESGEASQNLSNL